MQPVAIDIKIFECILKKMDEGNSFANEKFCSLSKNLNKFHSITLDTDQEGNSVLYEEIKELRNSLKDQGTQKYFDDLIIKRCEFYYISYANSKEKDFLYSIAENTPDRLLLSDVEKNNTCNINHYTLINFNSINYKPDCILYRIPKTIEIPAGHRYENFRFLAPFIREAQKIEFIDPYLFKNIKGLGDETQIQLIYDILKQIPHIKEIQFIFKIDLISNTIYKEFKEKFCKKNSNIILREPVNYFTQKNHDRFIIVNNDKISIKLTTSFNNFDKRENKYLAKKGLSIEFFSGRKYSDS